jgi:hypothetical protein
MHSQGRKKLGYFPLPMAEASRIRQWLSFPVSSSNALDPCVGASLQCCNLRLGPDDQRVGILGGDEGC